MIRRNGSVSSDSMHGDQLLPLGATPNILDSATGSDLPSRCLFRRIFHTSANVFLSNHLDVVQKRTRTVMIFGGQKDVLWLELFLFVA